MPDRSHIGVSELGRIRTKAGLCLVFLTRLVEVVVGGGVGVSGGALSMVITESCRGPK